MSPPPPPPGGVCDPRDGLQAGVFLLTLTWSLQELPGIGTTDIFLYGKSHLQSTGPVPEEESVLALGPQTCESTLHSW